MATPAKLDEIIEITQIETGEIRPIGGASGITKGTDVASLFMAADPLVQAAVLHLVTGPLRMLLLAHHPGFHRRADPALRLLVTRRTGHPGHTEMIPRSS